PATWPWLLIALASLTAPPGSVPRSRICPSCQRKACGFAVPSAARELPQTVPLLLIPKAMLGLPGSGPRAPSACGADCPLFQTTACGCEDPATSPASLIALASLEGSDTASDSSGCRWPCCHWKARCAAGWRVPAN